MQSFLTHFQTISLFCIILFIVGQRNYSDMFAQKSHGVDLSHLLVIVSKNMS